MLVAGLELSKISLILRNAVGLAACVWHSPNVHVLSRYVCALDQIRQWPSNSTLRPLDIPDSISVISVHMPLVFLVLQQAEGRV